MAGTSSASMSTAAYRKHLPDLAIPRFQTMKVQDAHDYIADFNEMHNPPWLHALVMHWKKLLAEPLTGVTNDGEHFILLKRLLFYAAE